VVQRKFLITARLFFGLLTLVAIGVELVIDIQEGHSLVNFFSFFTELSSIFAAIVLIIGTIHLIKRRQPDSSRRHYPGKFGCLYGSSWYCFRRLTPRCGPGRSIAVGEHYTSLHHAGCRGSRLALPATKVEAFSQAVMALAHFSIALLGLLVDPWRSH
jgi:hypothetical protein